MNDSNPDQTAQGAWARIWRILGVERTRNLLKRVANKRTSARLKRKISPSSLVHLAGERALNSAADVRAETDKQLEGYLVTVLEHVIVDQARYHGRRMAREVPLKQAEHVPTAGSASGDDKLTAMAVLKKAEGMLPEAQLQALRLRLRGLDYDEIGRELGCSARAARDKCVRAISALRAARKRGALQ